jgi:hypothetical protein
MNAKLLAMSLAEKARKLSDQVDANTGQTDPDHADLSELLRVLARILSGQSIERAFGAPGDWGYGTPIGDALAAQADAGELAKELDRMRVAWNTGLVRDVQPISRAAVDEGLRLLAAVKN